MPDETQDTPPEVDETPVEDRSVKGRLAGTVERRDFVSTDVEVRSTSDGGLRFSGYASMTETPYMVGSFEETFARGAFKQCLGNQPDVVLLINHEGLPLARTSSGTLTLTEDARGLKVDADLDPEDPDVQALVPKMKRKDLTEMSLAFRATDDEWDERETKRLVRAATIHKGDVSMVTRGASTTTSASVRDALVLLEERAASEDDRDAIEKVKGLLEPRDEPGIPADELAEPKPESRKRSDEVEWAKHMRARLRSKR